MTQNLTQKSALTLKVTRLVTSITPKDCFVATRCGIRQPFGSGRFRIPLSESCPVGRKRQSRRKSATQSFEATANARTGSPCRSSRRNALEGKWDEIGVPTG